LTRWARIGLGVAMVALGAAAAFGAGGTVQAANPLVTLRPAQQNVAIGAGTVTYTVNIADADNVAAYAIDLKFDPYVLEFGSAVNGGFLATSGRQVVCPGVALLAQQSPLNNVVSYGCATPGNLNGAGAAGSGLLVTLTFKLVGGGTSNLEFTKLDLLDANANPVCGGQYCTSQNTQGGSITVDGPVLPTATVDPAATPNSAAPAAPADATATPLSATQTAVAALPAATQTAMAVAAPVNTTGDNAQTGGAQTGTTQPSASGADATSAGAGGTAAQGSSQPGGAAQGANGAAVGKFGSGPDSYGHGSDNYGTKSVALAAFGFMLIVAGIWRRRIRDDRREAVRRR
jgi:hypothetical protein